MLHLALGILRCPTRWQRSFCTTATPGINISPSARFATVGDSSSRRPVGQHSPFLVSSGASVVHLRVSSFFEPRLFHLSAAKSWVLAEGFPLSLQSIISNQTRPRRLRGAWFSRLLRHPARRRSGSILSPGTHTGKQNDVSNFIRKLRLTPDFCMAFVYCLCV